MEDISTKDCKACAKKHLSAAIIVLEELLNGYANDARHEAYLEGNLVHAEEHLMILAPGMSNQIRQTRTSMFPNGAMTICNKNLDELQSIYNLLRSMIMAAENVKGDISMKRSCNCNKT